MRTYEICFRSIGSRNYPTPIVALVVEPDRVGPNTGAMLATHGWGGNRFQHQDKMEYASEALDLVCLAVEYRGSGYAFDPVKGAGWSLPYDASLYQTIDVLNGLRTLLAIRPELNRRRLFHYGGSQGGHIALLSAVFAPDTFACLYAASPIVHLDLPDWASDVGRGFQPHERSARNVLEHADRIRCPVLLEHGTADEVVPHGPHSVALEAKMKSLGKQVSLRLYEGAGHGLEPVTTRLETFREHAVGPMRTLATEGDDDFKAGRVIEIKCADRVLRIDWSKPPESRELLLWR